MNRYLEALNKVNDFEQENDLSSFDSEYGNLWPLFRFFIVNHFANNRVSLSYNNILIRTFGKIKNKIVTYFKYSGSIKSFKIDFNNVEEFWYSNSKLRLENKDNYNKYLDPFFLKLSSAKAVVFERDETKPTIYQYENILGDRDVYNIYTEYLRFSTFKISGKRKVSFRQFKKMFKFNELLDLFPELTIFDFFVQFTSFLDNYNFYNYFLFKYKNLKKIHLNAYYCTENIAIQSVSNKYGIEVVDIQHGVQAKGHYAYGNWEGVHDFDLLPNSFYVFSEQEKLLLNNSFRNQKNIRVVGNLMYEKWRSETRTNLESTNVILFSLQNNTFPINHFIFSFFKELDEKYNILLRLHPRHLYIKAEIEACFLRNEIAFTWDTKEDVFDSLENTVLHITEYSSVVKDALFFGIPSILIDKSRQSYYEEEIKNSGLVMCADNLNSLKDNFRLLTNKK